MQTRYLGSPRAAYLVRMHVECVDRQVIRCQVQTLEYLFKSQLVSISEDDDFL
jgi:hypothetical protein